MLVIRLLTLNSILTVFLWGLILTFIVYKLLSKKYTKALIFSFLFFMVGFGLPILHMCLNKYSKNNYHFEDSLITYTRDIEKLGLNKFSDSNKVRYCLQSLPDSELSFGLVENKIYCEFYFVKKTGFGRPSGRNKNSVEDVRYEMLRSTKDVSFEFEMNSTNNLKDYFQFYLNELAINNKKIINARENEFKNQFWIESISGFFFGEIKPISYPAKIIRLLQIFFTYLFITMFLKLVTSSGVFELKKKDS